MVHQEILVVVAGIIREQAPVRIDVVSPHWRLYGTEMQFDSLDLIELVMAVEKHFGIQIPDDITMEMGTVGDLVSYIDHAVG